MTETASTSRPSASPVYSWADVLPPSVPGIGVAVAGSS